MNEYKVRRQILKDRQRALLQAVKKGCSDADILQHVAAVKAAGDDIGRAKTTADNVAEAQAEKATESI